MERCSSRQTEWIEACTRLWQRLQDAKPLVQCITNFVSMDIMANTLNAVGASPAMVHGLEEVEDFVSIADCLLTNVGTLSQEWVKSMGLAAAAAREKGKPWVLDPVGAGATPFRTKAIMSLLEMRPAVVRGNASEIMALAGAAGGSRGVDSTAASNEAIEAAGTVARQFGAVVAVSGETDYVTDGERWLRVGNGVELLTRITAAGCSVTALVAALVAVACADGSSPLEGTAFGLGIFGVAAEIASQTAAGPASLRVNLLDSLYKLSKQPGLLRLRLHVEAFTP